MKLILFILGILLGLGLAAAIVSIILGYIWAWLTFGGNKK